MSPVPPALAAFVLLALAASGLGAVLLRGRAGAGLEGFLWRQALGLAGLIVLGWTLSFLGALKPWPAAVVLAPLAAWGAWREAAAWRGGPGPTFPRDWLVRGCLAGLVFYHGLGLWQALAPPTWGEGIHYLFLAAAEFGQAGQVVFRPDVYAARPQNMVLLFSLVQLFAEAEASQLVTWWLGLLSALALAGLGRRLAGRETGWLAALILSAMPIFTLLSGRGMSDLGVLFMGLMAALGLARAFQDGGVWPLAAAGVALGTAMGFKESGLTPAAVALLAGAMMAWRGRARWSGLAAMSLLALLLAAPWYAHSHLHTGVLFYEGGPMRGALAQADRERLFPHRDEAAAAVAARPKADEPPPNPGDPNRSPGMLARAWGRIGSNFVDPFTVAWRLNLMDDYRQRITGPLVLALFPLIFFFRPFPWTVAVAGLAGLGQAWLSAMLFNVYVRYSLWGLALACLPAAWTWRALAGSGRAGRALAVALMVLGLGVTLPEAIYNYQKEFRVAVGLTSRSAYLDKAFPGVMRVYDFLNRELPAEARVLMIAEDRPYYLKRPFVNGSPGRNPFLDSYFRTPEEWEADLRAMGMTHVLVNFQISDNAWDPKWNTGVGGASFHKMLRLWLARDVDEIFHSGDYHVYTLRPNPPKRP